MGNFFGEVRSLYLTDKAWQEKTEGMPRKWLCVSKGGVIRQHEKQPMMDDIARARLVFEVAVDCFEQPHFYLVKDVAGPCGEEVRDAEV